MRPKNSLFLTEFSSPFVAGIIKLRDLLSFSPIDILVKSADQKSYHAILQELKDKEIYNMIIDIHNTENMSDFLKAVRIDL
jgi:FlaA1/EpsC-like NDP-sugar epimerase